VSIRSLLEHVGIDVGDVIFIDGIPLDEEPEGSEAIEFDCS
jgi:FMN-dependent NADH-azoreductase